VATTKAHGGLAAPPLFTVRPDGVLVKGRVFVGVADASDDLTDRLLKVRDAQAGTLGRCEEGGIGQGRKAEGEGVLACKNRPELGVTRSRRGAH